MDTNSLINLYNGLKAYTVFLTNFFIPTGEKSDYILDKDLYNAAIFGLSNIILTSIKEDLIKGNRANFTTYIPDDALKVAVEELTTKTSMGYQIDNYVFKDEANFIGILRNKLAHGSYKLDLENECFIVNIEENYIHLPIAKFKRMVNSILDYFYYNLEEKTFSYNLLIMNPDEKRTKGLKTRSEILGAMKKIKNYTFKLKAKEGYVINDTIINSTLFAIEEFKRTNDLSLLNNYENIIKKGYEFTWKSKTIPEDVAKKASLEGVNTIRDDLSYEMQVSFLEDLATKHYNEGNINLISSLRKNLILLETVTNLKTIDREKVRSKLIDDYGQLILGYEEIASASIVLFSSLFCYGNDTFFENKNEFTSLDNTGLDYSLLNLDKLNIIYYEDNNTILEEEKIKIGSKVKEINKLNEGINKTYKNLENVVASGKSNVIGILNMKLNNLKQELAIKQGELSNLNIRLNEIYEYEKNNQRHLRNRTIINGIRNSISHGNFYIYSKSPKDKILVFTDIYEDRVTFKCEIDVIDFINMIYENDEVIDKFLNKLEEEKCISR